MEIVSKILVGFIAAIHIYILWLEMFGWTTFARKTFRRFPPELFEKTKPMAANQGLYNGFLAAGLIWSLCINDIAWSINVASFFLGCVVIAGLFGAATVQRSILFVQAVPAALALLAIYFTI
jgi:putative membrane protein